MAFVPVPKDLSKVKTKVALNLTKRQLICFSLAAAVGVPSYLLSQPTIGSNIAVLLMIGLMMPFFFLAMFEKDGQPAEKILRNLARAKLWPRTRAYKTENLYRQLQEEGNAIAGQKAKTTTATPKKQRNTGKK